MKKLKSKMLVILLLAVNTLYAQLPDIRTVAQNTTKNIVASGLEENMAVVVKNTSLVDLKFCLSGAPTASCASLSNKIVVQAGATVGFTIANLGGLSVGPNLNATNESNLLGATFTISFGSGLAEDCKEAILQAGTPPGLTSIDINGDGQPDLFIDQFGNLVDPCNECARYIYKLLDNNTLVLQSTGTGITNWVPANGKITLCRYGKVGIGTTAPTFDLHVMGSTKTDNLNVYGGVSIGYGAFQTPPADGLFVKGNITAKHIDLYSAKLDGTFYVANTSTFIGASTFNSKVGIGTSTIDAKLHINSSGGQKDLLITHSGVGYDYAAVIRVDNDLTKAFTIEKNGPATPVFRVDGNGNTYVGGTLKASVLIATANVWSDFVFEKDYQLMSLKELEKYIVKNKHLPEMPTTAEVMKDGIDIAEVQAKLLQKVEELTLHLIELKKENEEIKAELKKLK